MGVILNKYNIPGLEKMFIRDEEKILATIKQIFLKICESENDSEVLSKDELSSFTVAVHGIKSALASIGETELSAKALELEKASYDRNFDVIKKNTSELISSLEELEKKIKLSIENDTSKQINDTEPYSKEDQQILIYNLKLLITACEDFEINEAKSILKILLEKKWPATIHKVLEEINIHLLHSALKKAGALAEDTIISATNARNFS